MRGLLAIVVIGVFGCGPADGGSRAAEPDATESKAEAAQPERPPAEPDRFPPITYGTPDMWEQGEALSGSMGPPYQHPKAYGDITPVGQIVKRGDGPIPMVLICGLGADARLWEPFMERNADRYTMYAVALPGFAGGEAPPIPEINEPYMRQPWVRNAASAVVQVIVDENIDRPVLVGHGIGGQLALRIALATPDVTRGVVSLDGEPAFMLGPPDIRLDIRERVDFVRQKVIPGIREVREIAWDKLQAGNVRANLNNKEREELLIEMVTSAPMEVMHEYAIEFSLADVTMHMGKLQMPVLFIAPGYITEGQDDKINRELRWLSMLEQAPEDTQVVFFYGSSKWIMDDKPDELDAAVENFLAGEPIEGIPDPELEG